MTHESIRKLIFVILFGVIIIALWAMASSSGDQSESPSEVADEVTYYEIKTVANVSSALDKPQDDILNNKVDGELKCVTEDCVDLEDEYNQPSTPSADLDYSHIGVGQSDPLVYTVEYELQKKGFFTQEPDDMFGYKTLDALRLFQLSVGLPGTGKLDSKTISKIFGN